MLLFHEIITYKPDFGQILILLIFGPILGISNHNPGVQVLILKFGSSGPISLSPIGHVGQSEKRLGCELRGQFRANCRRRALQTLFFTQLSTEESNRVREGKDFPNKF